MGDLRDPNGVVLEESPVTSSSASVCSLGQEVWSRAEAATQEIIRQVQPTVVSEERRRDVIDYVQRLLKGYLNCEVFPFGSVPLKTYLPDGDIDLTAFCGFNFEEAFANDVFAVLEAEDHNPAAEFVVKDVQYIRAEVKLVKCLVQNIVVDISFNQIGGLCALCFLEEVDRLIGKDNLFKRSIILIKAWCYYESRILGAHHGLISTYALETLVLYIFHLFHSSLNGPLAVLHKFLDYFSKFDWDNFCVSLNGPVHVASLPEIVAGRPETSGGNLLLSDDFLRECVRKFSVPSRGPETNYRTFMQKHLNIVDPLKENNNLGRSVSRGNFFRIRSAFTFGARNLGQVLLQPQENIAEEVRKFFSNTLDRHGKGQRPDVQDLLLSGCNGLSSEILLPGAEPCQVENYANEEESVNAKNQSSDGRLGFEDTRHVAGSNFTEPGTCLEGGRIEHQKGDNKSSTTSLSEADLSKDELYASESRLSEDANDLATNGIRDLRITEGGDEFVPSMAEKRKLPSPSAPHLYFSQTNGKIENGNLYEQHTDSSLTCSKLAAQHVHEKDNSFMSWELDNSQLGHSHDLLTSVDSYSCYSYMNSDVHGSQDSHSNDPSSSSAGLAGRHEPVNLLPDLSGDAGCHLDNLQYGRWWYDHGLTMHIQPIHLAPPPMFQTKAPWDAIRQPVQFRRDMVPQMNVNGVVPRPTFFPTNPPVAHFNVDELSKARGTGPYFPITNYYSYKDRSSPKGRYHGQLKSPRNNGRGPTPHDRSPQVQPFVRQGVGKPKFSDFHETSPRGKVFKEANGFVHASEKAVAYDSPRHPLPEVALQERESCRPLDSDPSPGSPNGKPVYVVSNGRLSVQSYRLKDDDDFPPLSA